MFNLNSKKQNVVGFSLVPGIGLEAVVLDKARGTVINYGRKNTKLCSIQKRIA